jgi:hypothetical protein
VTGGRIKVCNEELHDMCFSLNIIWVSKSVRMQWWNMWHGQHDEMHTNFLLETWRKVTTGDA